MHYLLKQPLVVFDLEATGVDVEEDRIVEIAIIRLNPDGTRDTYDTLVDPGIPIPPESTEVHKITDAMVKDAPPFKEIAQEIIDFMSGCAVGGYNVLQYDLPLLDNEMKRHAQVTLNYADTVVLDAFVLFREQEPHTLDKAVQFYCHREHAGAHAALDDTEATCAVLEAQVAKYFNDVKDLEDLAERMLGDKIDRAGQLKWNDKDEAVFTFGKHKGIPLTEVPSSYFYWLRNNKVLTEVSAQKVLSRAMNGLPIKRPN